MAELLGENEKEETSSADSILSTSNSSASVSFIVANLSATVVGEMELDYCGTSTSLSMRCSSDCQEQFRIANCLQSQQMTTGAGSSAFNGPLLCTFPFPFDFLILV